MAYAVAVGHIRPHDHRGSCVTRPHLQDADAERLRGPVLPVEHFGDLLGKLPPSPPSAAGEVSTQLTTKSQEVAFGQTTPEDAGAAFAKEAQDILDRAAKKS